MRGQAFPGVGFTKSRMGYRPVLVGTRLAVWEVVATLRSNGGEVEQTATDLGLTRDQVGVCARYYATYEDEVDSYTEELERAAARERALQERQRAIFS